MSKWSFWVDVGGTFTDCIGQAPEGRLHRRKILSSGATKGAVAEGSHSQCILDPRRQQDPPGYWVGSNLRLLDENGLSVGQSLITHSDPKNGELRTQTPLGQTIFPDQPYEIAAPHEAPIMAIRHILRLPADRPIPESMVRLGTTRGTNALLTRGGARTAWVTTHGFGDLLRIGNQQRPRLFELTIHKTAPLFEKVLEIAERVTAEGNILEPVQPDRVRGGLAQLRRQGVESLAICLLNAYAYPGHEQVVGRIARELGFVEISLSHQVAPLIKMVARGDTTVVDAYLTPVLREYVDRLRTALPNSSLQILTSAGGLVDATTFQGKDSILSGPAGGVVGFSQCGLNAGFPRTIGFDMGGTSTDVSRFDGTYEIQYESEKAGVRIVSPTMAIETVAAGGGSICHFDGVKLVVGPDSAGADPGPACYGGGGPLAITDLNLFLGKIPQETFPFPLSLPPVLNHLERFIEDISTHTGTRYTPEELADGFIRVANANMARAIRNVSVVRGADPRDHVLVAFGGAAGQHACAVARELGIRQVLVHPDAGILSASGVGLADITRHRAMAVYERYSPEILSQRESAVKGLAEEARREVEAEGGQHITVKRKIELRYVGQDTTLTLDWPEEGSARSSFEDEHRRLYGYIHPERALELVTLRIEVAGSSGRLEMPALEPETTPPQALRRTTAWFAGHRHQTPVYRREDLRPGQSIAGPSVIAEPRATTIIDPGWSAQVLKCGELLLTDARQSDTSARVSSSTPDPVLLEIFNHRFAAIAEQMGITLRNTASSVNVKERLDFSCALFTAHGDLVVNAPHIPVHLGAMGETVRSIISDNPLIRPGDVFVTNDPYRGGSHLPDVTVVTPVHDASKKRLLFFTASRAHHAEIGGVRPGSMPPASTRLSEEGVLLSNLRVVSEGRSRLDALESLLRNAEYPSRAVADNLADVTAAIAANRLGAHQLMELMERHGLPVVLGYMQHIQDAAERKMRSALHRLPDGQYPFQDHLDDGSVIAVRVSISGDQARIDFTGTAPVHPGNFNANRAIVTAAVLYVLRCLINEDIPLNQGVLNPVEIVLPECLLNPPRRSSACECAAVVGGNVETSQRVVDVLLGALKLAAASQGTMNNLLFGDATFGYYETVCGGSGATPEGPGAEAVHTHMTNTRLTDPEVLEKRFPIRVREFSIRRHSGGAGRFPGGDGVVRSIEFLKPLDVSLMSQRRGTFPPFGLEGGRSGSVGLNVLTRADGTRETLPGCASFSVLAGDVLRLETPGGGGYGKAP